MNKKTGVEETSVISEAWISERTKGWESVASCAKTLISKSRRVPSEVKAYYQKSKSSAIISRCQRSLAHIHVVSGEDSGSKSHPLTHQKKEDNTDLGDVAMETNKKEKASAGKKKQKVPQKFAEQKKTTASFGDDNSSDDLEWSDMKYADIQDPKDRRDRARKEKRKRKANNNGDDDDESDSDEPQIKKKAKSELQREALEKHSLMCDTALSTMQKMQGLLDKLQNKI